MAKKAKKMSAALANIDREKFYGLEEAVKILKGYEKERKFDQTVDIAVNTCLDPRHADQVLRGVTELPNGTGKSVRVAVFARDEKAEEAKVQGQKLAEGSGDRLFLSTCSSDKVQLMPVAKETKHAEAAITPSLCLVKRS